MRKVIILIGFLLGCGVHTNAQHVEISQKLENLMVKYQNCDGKKPVCSFLLYLKNSDTQFRFNKGLGVVGRDNTPVDDSFQYNVASITKTLVAAIILQLEEEGKLDINAPIKEYLQPIEFVRYDDLHVYKGKKYQDSITIKMLLNHTSGISDVFTDAETKFNISVFLRPKKKYSAQTFYKKYFQYKLNQKPKNLPGKGYHYSDINYMLLGFIIEQIEHKTLPEAIRQRIIEPLQLKNTYFEYYEEERGEGKRIDAFINKINITKRVNTSYEWAGGGIVSNIEEMAHFIEALFEMKFFKKDKTLKKMIDISDTAKYGAHYGLGVYKYKYDGKIFYGHGGFYGSILAYSPEHKLTISSNIGQSSPPFNRVKLIDKVIAIISKN